jgi:hypothetical protein
LSVIFIILLFFDAKNPRLVEFVGKQTPSQDELLEFLWTEMAADEVAMSIAADGFWDYEPLIVAVENDRNVVIEGNRRLAAVKLLLDAEIRRKLKATDLPKASAATIQDLQVGLPVIVRTRKEAWRYLGFKHVNGPAKWDSYAKAQYIGQVHNEYGIPLEDIAAQIGDRHRTVQRLYRALMVIEQAERESVFNREHRSRRHFSFSHLYTGLDYEGFEDFLELSDADAEKEDPVPPSRIKELGEVCKWLYGDKRDDITPLIQSQNPDLRNLAEVLTNDDAVSSLRTGMPLSLAVEVSRGDDTIFRQSLTESKQALQKAHSTLSTGYDGNTSLLRVADEVATLTYDLAEQMERIGRKPKRRRPSPHEEVD